MNYKLYYWPIPFRGEFIRLILAERGEDYIEADTEELLELKATDPADQPLPMLAPPFLHDLKNDIFINQMPVIVMYLSEKLGLLPRDNYKSAICLKLTLDSNDLLAELTNLNGSAMWEHEKWKTFRQQRLKHWFRIFEQTGRHFGLSQHQGFLLGSDQLSTADLVTSALFGTMTRCLPELSDDFRTHAPNVYALCQRIAAFPNVNKFTEDQTQKYGNSYCGGQIEKSIRSMLAEDSK